MLVTLPGASGPVVQVAAGLYHSLVLTSTGQLYAFGDNYYGELGNAINDKGKYTSQANPTPALVTLPGEVGPVTAVAAGRWFSLAVTSSGQLYSFGENYSGQLGRAANDDSDSPSPTPALVTLPGAAGPVTQVAAGQEYGLALSASGQLYAFGENGCGQLGNTTNLGSAEPNPTPALVSVPGASGQIVQIAAGGESSLVLTSTGRLFGFGCDIDGALGFPPGEEEGAPHPTPLQIALPGGANAGAIASGPVAYDTLVVLGAGVNEPEPPPGKTPPPSETPPPAPPPSSSGETPQPSPSGETPPPSIYSLPPTATFTAPGNLTPATPAVTKKVTKKKAAKCRKGKTRNKRGVCVQSKPKNRKR